MAASSEGDPPAFTTPGSSPMRFSSIAHRSSFLVENAGVNVDTTILSPSVMSPPSSTRSTSMRRASMELLNLGLGRSRRSIIDVRNKEDVIPLIDQESVESLLLLDEPGGNNNNYGAATNNNDDQQQLEQGQPSHFVKQVSSKGTMSDWILAACCQIPAIAIASILNLMMSIPFGVSYFPIGWRNNWIDESGGGAATDSDGFHGPFPLANKEALGIRMFLFSTIVGQIVLTFASKFKNPIALQMVENVPFFHSLAFNVISVQGYGLEALSTLFFLFGLSSVLVGLSFYTLGKLELGRVVYFFPNHVLVGCIGGIGVFIAISSIEVSTNTKFAFNKECFVGLIDNIHLILVVVIFEVCLRILLQLTQDKDGRTRFPLLSPAYFCMITPLFYLGLWLLGISKDRATESGFFFPATVPICSTSSDCHVSTSMWSLVSDDHLWDMFKIININKVSWEAVFGSIGTMAALVSFSALHIPINIPAFAISADVDADMNAELIAHGYSNAFAGLFGGLQNYMTYSNSVLYARSGGEGRISSLAVAATTCVLFVVGPSLATSIPRCMAGTLLLHIGVDLFMEGVYDSFGKYDNLEYAGIWLITIVMTACGMTAALIAGIIAALSTYVVQSVVHPNPIRSISTATTLRSSAWNRSPEASSILDDDYNGRSRILVIQLQGYLFFGNIATLTDTIKEILNKLKGTTDEPCVVIIDFGLVVGMDSSASHAVAKLKGIFRKLFRIHATIFVTGSESGFPCEFALSRALSAPHLVESSGEHDPRFDSDPNSKSNTWVESHLRDSSLGFSAYSESLQLFASCRVCGTLDEALIIAEDVLIARQNPEILMIDSFHLGSFSTDNVGIVTLEQEKELGTRFIANLCPGCDHRDAVVLLSHMAREEFKKDEVIWTKGSESDCLKLLVKGTCISYPDETQKPELVRCGNFIGELGVVNGTRRLSTVVCLSSSVVVFSLQRETWDLLSIQNPNIAKMVLKMVIKYLYHRLQHVKDCRNLPI